MYQFLHTKAQKSQFKSDYNICNILVGIIALLGLESFICVHLEAHYPLNH